jgi:hypothetical protein
VAVDRGPELDNEMLWLYYTHVVLFNLSGLAQSGF